MPNSLTEGVRKFFSPKEEVYDQWLSSADNFEFVTDEFYQMIERELLSRKVPGLQMSRVEFAEGGLLSDKREYLRLRRERLVFDICAARFGTSYFWSFRAVELPLGIKLLELIVFFAGVLLLFFLLVKFFGMIGGFFALIALFIASIYVMRNSVALGLKDLDHFLMKTPIIGPLYELFLRRETYYREDTRRMYVVTVDAITKALVEEITAAKGIKLLNQFERRAPIGELSRPPEKPTTSGEGPIEGTRKPHVAP